MTIPTPIRPRVKCAKRTCFLNVTGSEEEILLFLFADPDGRYTRTNEKEKENFPFPSQSRFIKTSFANSTDKNVSFFKTKEVSFKTVKRNATQIESNTK